MGSAVFASKGEGSCSCVNRGTGINFQARIVNRFPVFTDHQFRGVSHYELHGGGLSGRKRRVVARRCAGIDRAGHENQIAGSSGACDRLGRPKGQGDVSVPGQKRQGERAGYRRIETWRYIRLNLIKTTYVFVIRWVSIALLARWASFWRFVNILAHFYSKQIWNWRFRATIFKSSFSGQVPHDWKMNYRYHHLVIVKIQNLKIW